MKIRTSPGWLFFTLGFLAANFSPAIRAELIVTPVAMQGQRAPGTAEGAAFTGNFSDVQVNHSGQVLFLGSLHGSGISSTNRTGMWIGLPGGLEKVVQTGQVAPDSGGEPFTFLSKPVLDRSGTVMFYAITRPLGIGVQLQGISSDLGSTFTSWVDEGFRIIHKIADTILFEYANVVRKTTICRDPKYVEVSGDSKTDEVIGALSPFQRFWLEKVEVKIDFVPRTQVLQGNPVESPRPGLLITSDHGATNLVVVGDAAPGVTNQILSLDQFALAGGALTFAAKTSDNKSGIWSGSVTNLRPVAFSRAVLPPSLTAEFGAGARWGGVMEFSGIGMNTRAEVAFKAGIFRGSDFLGSFLFTGPPDALRVAARFVSQPDTTGEGFTSAGQLVMNAAGDVAFIGAYTSLKDVPGIGGIPGAGVNGLGLTHRRGSPKLVLAEGKTAPGLAEGEVISFFGFGGGPFMNRHGQVLIHAEIGKAVGFEHRTDQGIWLVDPVRGPQLVARGGMLIDIGGGQRRIIEPKSVGFRTTHDEFRSGGEDGRPKPFNDLGQVVFVASWREANGAFNSGVFVAGEVRLLNGHRDGDDIHVSFATALGKAYRVEFRSAVESGPWTTLKDNVPGTGGPVIVTDAGAAKQPKRFYRVTAL